ncbi:IS1 family transposase [Thermodesulforhabdus norvegica]|nr:IS1 family transposase [Thermodesulforhabdus norvegica]
MSLDETWTYVGCRRGAGRNGNWMWTCLADGRFLFEVGSRSEGTFLRFYDEIPEAEVYYTDDFKVYDWLPFNRHVKGARGKAKTNRNEGRHSILKDKLAGLRRKTKAYSRSALMLCGSIALLTVKNNWI